MIQLTIDHQAVSVAPGTTILAAARGLGIAIPTLCQVEGFEPAASCFLCAVQIEGRPNVWPSCAMPVAEGMSVVTNSEAVRAIRRTALELLLSDHAGDCIGPCRTGCPAGLEIPEFIDRLATGDPAGASMLVHDGLTLPASLGRVCPRLCEQRCRQGEAEEPLSIRNLHRFAADTHPPEAPRPRPPATGRRVAIVGAGPAGLAAAALLLRRGHAVVLWEAHPEAGGMLRYGIPAFRLPRAVLDREIETVRQAGAEFRFGQRLGREVSLAQLRQDFDAVFVAIGAQGSRGLGCPGESLATSAVGFLEAISDAGSTRGSEGISAEGRIDLLRAGGAAVIVGGGNTAMDAARCAVRLGAKSVRVLYRRTRAEMPCLMEEVEAAEAEGVQIDFLVAPLRLERQESGLALLCQRMALGAPDESGRPRPMPVPGSEFTVPAALVIAAIGQTVETGSLAAPDLAVSKWGLKADPMTLATNLPGVFAGGDAVTGPDLAVRAVAAGRLAAASIDQYLAGRSVTGLPRMVNALLPRLEEDELAAMLRGIEQGGRSPMPHLPMEQRRSSFAEVELGFTAEVAARESHRCLGCGCGKAIPCRLRQYATEYGVDPHRFPGERRHFSRDSSHPDVIYEPGKCILCGACLQVAAKAHEAVGVAFIGRGFQVAVGVPFTQPMAEALRTSARGAAEACPTGAIILRDAACAGCRGHFPARGQGHGCGH